MADYKTYRKYSTTLKASEFRSYGRNKMEDRKLALHNDGLDKNIERRRKSFVSEKDQINKHFTEKVSKTTPSLEQYLQRSQTKYDAWKLREQERLDRRYRGLYKSYLKEYSDLQLEDLSHLTGVRKLSTSSDTSDNYVVGNKKMGHEKERAEIDEIVQPGETEINDGIKGGKSDTKLKDEASDTVVALEEMTIGMKRHTAPNVTDSHCSAQASANSRRFSTGGVLFQTEKKINVSKIHKNNDSDMDASGLTSSVPNESAPIYPGDSTVQYERRSSKGGDCERRSSKGDNCERRSSKGGDVDTALPQKPSKKKARRNSSLKPVANIKVPMGARLDRRSTLANINIAVKYGN